MSDKKKKEQLLIQHHSSEDYNLQILLEQLIKSQLTVHSSSLFEATDTKLQTTGIQVLKQTRGCVIRIHKISKYLQRI